MFYELVFDMDIIDEGIKNGTSPIYARESNIDDIEYEGIKKGFFRHILTDGKEIENWPLVEFYYSSKASNNETEYLLNIKGWLVIHKKVQEEFEKRGIQGIQYLPVELINIVKLQVNNNYVAVNILNMIEAYDMDKSEYTYDEEYDMYSFLPPTTYLDHEVCKNYDIFRATKDSEAVYVSQKIKDIIEEHNWVGFCFYKRKVNEPLIVDDNVKNSLMNQER